MVLAREQKVAAFFLSRGMAQACPPSCQGEPGTSKLVTGSKPGFPGTFLAGSPGTSLPLTSLDMASLLRRPGPSVPWLQVLTP